MDLIVIRDFAIALFIGALIGIEREKRKMDEDGGLGGIRTFILLSMAGAASGWLSSQLGSPWIFGVTLLLAVSFVIAGYSITVRSGAAQPGLTTEVAALVTVLLGGLVMFGWPGLAVGLGITTAAVLAFKAPLHGLVDKVGQEDLYAGLSLLIASFIILPILPNGKIDPLDALNPRSLWMLVILIAAMSEVGYIAVRALGSSRGTALTGFFGGIASSTAVTLSFSRKSKEGGAPAAALAAGILLAWLVMVLRIVVLIVAVHRPLIGYVALPIGVMGALTLVAVIVFLRQGAGHESRGAENVPLRNPFSLGSAIRFALFFAVILLVVAAVRKYLPPSGVYLVAGLAGLTDADAITLSMARMAQDGGGEQLAARAITIAAVTNTLIKGGMVVGLGSRDLARRVAPAALIILLSGLVAAFVA
ncbi:MAG TPA: MgtC/SapB family protein [Gemmatimonadales bacterium]|nr:MgtC/SapB family protein [Gemmatimonadales bacterium]